MDRIQRTKYIWKHTADLHRSHNRVDICVVQTQHPIKDANFVISEGFLTLPVELEEGPNIQAYNSVLYWGRHEMNIRLTSVQLSCTYGPHLFQERSPVISQWDTQLGLRNISQLELRNLLRRPRDGRKYQPKRYIIPNTAGAHAAPIDKPYRTLTAWGIILEEVAEKMYLWEQCGGFTWSLSNEILTL